MSNGGANNQPLYSQAMVQQPTQPGFAVGAPMANMPYQPMTGFQQGAQFANQFAQFNPFGQNPQMQQYRQQVMDWRNQRPDFADGMNQGDFRQQFQDWRNQRPERNFAPMAQPQNALQPNPALGYGGLLSNLIGG